MIKEFLETPVSHHCDVLVCGGGFAGIAAAISAARQGAKVTLLEKQYLLGGLGTAGLITIYLPICDGMGRQVSFGLAEELLRLSISMGAEAEYPVNWLSEQGPRTEKDSRFRTCFNPYLFGILAEQLLLKEGVEILYGTYAVGVSKQDDKIDAVVIESKSGRQAIRVGSVVDATGDADIAFFAGIPTANYAAGNILAAWYYGLGKDGYRLKILGCSDTPPAERRGAPGTVERLSARRFGGLDNKEVSEMMQLSHAATLRDIEKLRSQDPTLIPTSLATIPQLRMTRRIVGEYELHDTQMHTFFEDSVGMVSDWRKRGPVYEVPFRTLYSKTIKNVIVAGRCTSVTDPMWDVMRVIPCCAVTGEAAGIAAAMTDDFGSLDVAALQRKLQESGVVLHENELP